MAALAVFVRSMSEMIFVNFCIPLFWEHKFSTADISDTFYRRETKFGVVKGSGQ